MGQPGFFNPFGSIQINNVYLGIKPSELTIDTAPKGNPGSIRRPDRSPASIGVGFDLASILPEGDYPLAGTISVYRVYLFPSQPP